METDSYDNTPPLSPKLAGVEEFFEEPPIDSAQRSQDIQHICNGKVDPQLNSDSHPAGPLRSGAVDRLTNVNDSEMTAVVDLFGYSFMAPTALEDDVDKLFYMARQNFFTLEDLQNMKHGVSDVQEPAIIRLQLAEFMQYVHTYIERYITENHTDILAKVFNHIKGMLLCMGSLHKLPSNVLCSASSNLGINCQTAQYHTFHCHLELHWAIIECLHTASRRFPGDLTTVQVCEGDTPSDLFYQVTHLLLWDITLLALNSYNKLEAKEHGQVSIFPCACVKEMLIMLIHLLQHRQQSMARESLWVMLMPVIQHVLTPKSRENSDETERDSDVFPSPPDYVCDDRTGFCWWFIHQIVPLFSYNKHGYFNHQIKGNGNYFLILEMLKKSLQLPEALLRAHLRYMVNINNYWESSTEVVLKLLDHFLKKLNDQFLVGGLSLSGFASISKTPSCLLERSRKLATGDLQSFDNDCSYHLFLRILANHLLQDHTGTEWRQLKARVYMKFHGRRVHELTETGLQNVSLLFLVLAQVTELSDVSEKLFEVYSQLSVSQLEIARRASIWRGTFALMMLHEERGTGMAFLADKLAGAFTAVSKEIISGDNLKYADLWTLISLYIESTQEVIDGSPALALQEHRLIVPAFGELLKVCRENELHQIFTFVQNLLTKHRIVYKRALQQRDGANQQAVLGQYRDLSDAVWQSIYPFLLDHSKTQTPPTLLADVAAGFALLVIDIPPSVKTQMQVTFLQVYSDFAWGENVNPKISVRFLCNTLSNHSCMEKLQQDLPDFESFLIKAWFKALWVVPAELTTELSRLILKLNEVNRLLINSGLEPDDQDGPSTFLQALDVVYQNTVNLQDKIKLRERSKQYFGDIAKQLPTLLKNCSSTEQMNSIYQLGGYLTKYCAPMLYMKSRPDCLLPSLIERLALPRTLLNPNKALPAHVTTAIRNHLHLYVHGLARMDYKRDAYIHRKLKDIICHYMTRFPVWSGSGGVSLVHPLLTCLEESCNRNAKEEAIIFRCDVLKIIVEEFISLKGVTAPPNAAMGWSFISELQKKTTNAAVIAHDAAALLRISLDYQLLCETASLNHHAMQTLQCTLERLRLQPHALPSAEVSSILSGFVAHHLPIYQARVFTVLERAATLHPEPFVSLIPTITQQVRLCEAKRGVGLDKQLRVAYYNFLGHLGEKGDEEKSSLLRDS